MKHNTRTCVSMVIIGERERERRRRHAIPRHVFSIRSIVDHSQLELLIRRNPSRAAAMFTKVGLNACNGSVFRLPSRAAAYKNASSTAVKRVSSQHRSVTSLASAFHNSTRAKQSSSPSLLLLIAGGTSLFAYSINANPLRCDPTTQSARPYAEPHTVSVQGPGSAKLTRRDEAPAFESSVDLKSLSFGAVAGISTGIFIKKGLKAVGFLLGGAFVLLQVSHRDHIRVR